MDHRKPPKPENWDAPMGVCRWCGCCIYGLRGENKGKPLFNRRWHNKCAEEYKFIFWPQVTRSVLWQNRGGKCHDCGLELADPRRYWVKRGNVAEHHHSVPLIDFPHDSSDPYAAWKEGNLVLLCHACHLVRGQQWRDSKKQPDPQLSLLSPIPAV